MKKTLRNLVIYPLMAASLFFTGCNAKSPVQKTIDSVVYEAISGKKQSSYNPNANQVKENTAEKGLASYLFQGDELNYLSSPSKKIAGTDFSNPALVNVNSLNGEDREAYEAQKIQNMGIGEYKVKEIEDYSKKRDLSLEVMEFKTEADKESYIAEELDGPHFSKGNILAYINPDFEEVRTSDEFSDGQKVFYMDLIQDYAKRTGLEMVLSQNKAENQELLDGINEFINDYYAKNTFPKKSVFEEKKSIFEDTSKERIVISEGQKTKSEGKALDSYFFKGDESKFVKLAKSNLEGFAENPGINYTKDSRGTPDWVSQYFGDSSDSLKSLNVLSTGSAVYTLPKIEKNSEEKEVILGSVEFESSKDMKKFLNEKSREEGLISYPLFVGDNSISFISMTTIDEMVNLSKEQQIAYMNLVLDYADRTGMKPVLSGNEKDSKILLERFKQYQD